MDWDLYRTYSIDPLETDRSDEQEQPNRAAISPKDRARPYAERWDEIVKLLMAKDLHFKISLSRFNEILNEIARWQGRRSLEKGSRGKGEIETCARILRDVQIKQGRKPKSR